MRVGLLGWLFGKHKEEKGGDVVPTVESLPEIMTVLEVAEFLRLDQRTVSLRLLRSGLIHATKIGGKWRITRQAVESYLAGKDGADAQPK